MAQQAQPRRQGDDPLQAQGSDKAQLFQDQDPQQLEDAAIRYGDVFAVSGDLAGQPIAPRDAAAMRSAEDSVPPGVQVPRQGGGGFSAATAKETAAAYNEAVGAVRPGQASDTAAMHGITVTQTAVPGGRVVTELVAGQVVGQYSVADPPPPAEEEDAATKITIGEALEATARAGGGRPIDRADAEAIRAAEMSARGADVAVPGGLGDVACAAARANSRATRDRDKVKLGDVLSDATAKLAGDKAATTEDATRVVRAETMKDAGARAKAGGVGAAMATAARLNQDNNLSDT